MSFALSRSNKMDLPHLPKVLNNSGALQIKQLRFKKYALVSFRVALNKLLSPFN